MTWKLIAVDPGKQHAGVAEYINGKLTRATLIQGQRPSDVSRGVAAWSGDCDELICEGQQIYGKRGDADPNDLLPLAQVVGAVVCLIKSKEYQIILPRIWTGGIPKEIRLRKYLQQASPAEMVLLRAMPFKKDQMHNVLDAICLGAWHLGRIPITKAYKQ